MRRINIGPQDKCLQQTEEHYFSLESLSLYKFDTAMPLTWKILTHQLILHHKGVDAWHGKYGRA